MASRLAALTLVLLAAASHVLLPPTWGAEPTRIKVAAISLVPVPLDLEGNSRQLEQAFRKAAAGGARLAVAPEGALEGYIVNQILRGEIAVAKMREVATPTDHPRIQRFQKLARELHLCLVFGFAELVGSDVFNAAIFIDDEGEIRGKYHKMQLAEGYHPDWWFNRLGTSSRAFDTPLGRCGILICNDRWNPALAKLPRLDGAQFLVIPSFGSTSQEQDEAVLSRSRETGLPIVEANVGVTLIAGEGQPRAVSRERTTVTFAEIEIPPPNAPRSAERDQAEREFLQWREPEMAARFARTLARHPHAASPQLSPRAPEILELWPGAPPDEPGTIGPEYSRPSPQLSREQVEVTTSTRLITNVTRPTISVVRPEPQLDTGTAIIICPGGGYWDLYWELEGEEVAAWLAARGITGVILKYRVPRRPDEPKTEPARRPLQDAQRAIRLVRHHAERWGVHPQRIGMIGFSAGGHLVVSTATEFERRSYPPRDAIDDLSCRPDFGIAAYSGYLQARGELRLSPGIQIPRSTPPLFLVHGSNDPISPPTHSVVLYLALREAQVPAELHLYAATTHDFGVRASERPYGQWSSAAERWLSDQKLLIPRSQP